MSTSLQCAWTAVKTFTSDCRRMFVQTEFPLETVTENINRCASEVSKWQLMGQTKGVAGVSVGRTK